jgi:hypothetical protein
MLFKVGQVPELNPNFPALLETMVKHSVDC